MDQLIRNVAKFNAGNNPVHRAQVQALAHTQQRPKTLLITCVDSRVVPGVLAESEPGEVLTLRNIGNIVPSPEDTWVGGDTSVASTISFALEMLEIPNIVLMGHSGCGGMGELMARASDFRTDSLGAWIRHGRRSLERLSTDQLKDEGLDEVDRLSQLNVLVGLQTLSHFPEVRQRLDRMSLTLHGWWFDLASGTVLAFEPRAGRFLPVEQAYESALSSSVRPEIDLS